MVITDEKDKILPAYLNIQTQVQRLKKDAVNDFEKYTYLTLDAMLELLRPLCNKEGLILLQEPVSTLSEKQNSVTIVTHLIHAESGQKIEFRDLVIPVELNHVKATGASQLTPKSVGSSITYGKKYALAAYFGIASEDDPDGTSAKKSGKTTVIAPEDDPVQLPGWKQPKALASCKEGELLHIIGSPDKYPGLAEKAERILASKKANKAVDL